MIPQLHRDDCHPALSAEEGVLQRLLAVVWVLGRVLPTCGDEDEDEDSEVPFPVDESVDMVRRVSVAASHAQPFCRSPVHIIQHAHCRYIYIYMCVCVCVCARAYVRESSIRYVSHLDIPIARVKHVCDDMIDKNKSSTTAVVAVKIVPSIRAANNTAAAAAVDPVTSTALA